MSTTELKIYFKAPKPVQTLWKPRAQPELSPLLGPSERRVLGKAPRSSCRAAQRWGRAQEEGTWGSRVAVTASVLARREGPFHNRNYLVPQPSKRDQREVGRENWNPSLRNRPGCCTRIQPAGWGGKDRSTEAVKAGP